MTDRAGGAVLVVDDDEINRLLLSGLLGDQGYRVRTAADGAEALEALEEESFDAVLLDVVMPGIDGIEALRTIKRDSRLWYLPVIMISSIEDTTSIVHCIELGATDFVSKPFDPVILRAKISGCLARKRLHDLEIEYQQIVKEQAARAEDMNRDLARRLRDQVSRVERRARFRRVLPSALADPVLVSDARAAALDRPRFREVWVVHAVLSGLGAPDPEMVSAVLSGFHSAVDELAGRFEATVASSAGNEATAVFDDVLPCPDAGPQAVRMAQGLGDLLEPLANRWPSGRWGVGVARGPAALGTVEHAGRADYWAIGPAVDRATGLARQAAGEVLVDESIDTD